MSMKTVVKLLHSSIEISLSWIIVSLKDKNYIVKLLRRQQAIRIKLLIYISESAIVLVMSQVAWI